MATTTTKKPAARRETPEPTPVDEPLPFEEAVALEDDEIVGEQPEMTPSEREEAIAEYREYVRDLLADMPPLRAPERFRVGHRGTFTKLSTKALTSGVFDGDGRLDFDLSKPGDAVRYDAFIDFVTSIDEWAESIAEDPDAYAAWSEGKTADTFMALFNHYRDALGESQRSES